MTFTADLTDLGAALPEGVLTTAPETLEAYRTDRSHPDSTGRPIGAVRARGLEDVVTTMRWASANGVPVVPRGAGSGLSGGALSIDGGLVLSLAAMRDLTVDPAARTVTAGPGVLNAEVKQAAAEHGLWYPPDPSSTAICSIGGNIATNAGGLCCVKYGVTTDYVLGLQVVLADGTVVDLGGQRIKDVAGLPLLKLFVGSEGTLGVVTRVTLRLVPAPPPPATLVATFPTVTAAAEAVVTIGRTLRPSMMELMDRATINAVQDHRDMGLDRSAGALLIAQSDAPGATRATEIASMHRSCLAFGASECFTTEDPDEGEQFIAARRLAIDAIEARGAVMLEDVGVPVPLLPELLRGIEEIAARHDVEIPVVAHAGDGNTHPVIVHPPGDEAVRARAREAFGEVMSLAISLGGTITGEHGVGRLKLGSLAEQLGPDVMDLNRRIKQALDPQGILNPGVGYE